jgi:predicted ATPase
VNNGYVTNLLIDTRNANKEIYPYNIFPLKNHQNIKLDNKVTFFIGENGTGKSTLIEAIALAYGFNAEGGSTSFSFETKNSSSELYKHIRMKRSLKRPKTGYFFRAESFYNVATNIESLDELPAPCEKIIKAYGGKSLHEQSRGESFFSLILNRFCKNGFYILDEPESGLSLERQFAFISRLNELVDEQSQFIIATHSPIILAYPHSTIYQITENGMCEVEYEQTNAFKFMKMFAENHSNFLNELLKAKE